MFKKMQKTFSRPWIKTMMEYAAATLMTIAWIFCLYINGPISLVFGALSAVCIFLAHVSEIGGRI